MYQGSPHLQVVSSPQNKMSVCFFEYTLGTTVPIPACCVNHVLCHAQGVLLTPTCCWDHLRSHLAMPIAVLPAMPQSSSVPVSAHDSSRRVPPCGRVPSRRQYTPRHAERADDKATHRVDEDDEATHDDDDEATHDDDDDEATHDNEATHDDETRVDEDDEATQAAHDEAARDDEATHDDDKTAHRVDEDDGGARVDQAAQDEAAHDDEATHDTDKTAPRVDEDDDDDDVVTSRMLRKSYAQAVAASTILHSGPISTTPTTEPTEVVDDPWEESGLIHVTIGNADQYLTLATPRTLITYQSRWIKPPPPPPTMRIQMKKKKKPTSSPCKPRTPLLLESDPPVTSTTTTSTTSVDIDQFLESASYAMTWHHVSPDVFRSMLLSEPNLAKDAYTRHRWSMKHTRAKLEQVIREVDTQRMHAVMFLQALTERVRLEFFLKRQSVDELCQYLATDETIRRCITQLGRSYSWWENCIQNEMRLWDQWTEEMQCPEKRTDRRRLTARRWVDDREAIKEQRELFRDEASVMEFLDTPFRQMLTEFAFGFSVERHRLEVRRVISTVFPQACASCSAAVATTRCSRCKWSWYCSTACFKRHWKAGHKDECEPIHDDHSVLS